MKSENKITLNKYFSHKNLSEGSKAVYTIVLNNYSKIQEKSLKELINEAKEESIPYLNNKNQIIIPNIEDSQLSDRIYYFIDLQQQKNRKPNGIESDLRIIKAFYNSFNLKFPKTNLQKEKTKLNILPKSKIEQIINTCTYKTGTIYLFLMSTGVRISDAINFTIEDFIEATQLHTIKNILQYDTTLDAPLGYWEFKPQKTKNSSGIICKTCSTPEVNKRIIEYLKNRNEKKPLKLSQKLFLTNTLKNYYKTTLSSVTNKISTKFKQRELEKYKEQLENDEISKEKYNRLVEQIPKFHCHGLRKYFCTVLANNAVPLRIAATMEGHVAPLATDKHYVDITREAVIEQYYNVLPDLTLAPTEVKVVESDERRKIHELEDKLRMLQNSFSNREKLIINED